MNDWNLDEVEQQQLWDYLDEKWVLMEYELKEQAHKLIDYDSRFFDYDKEFPDEVIDEVTTGTHDSGEIDLINYSKGYQDAMQDVMNTMERIQELREEK